MATAGTTVPIPDEARIPPLHLVRFDRAERWLHAINALLVLTLIATGSVMYIGSLSGLVGRRELVRTVHLWAGLALPLPFLITVIGPWGRGFRHDCRRLGRFLADDRRWLRRRERRSGRLRIGKFNAGQKLNAILVAGALPVMFATGVALKWHGALSDSLRTGVTFVHDWGYVCLGLLVGGHIAKALLDPIRLHGMRTGKVPTRWAAEEHPRWHDEVVGPGAVRPYDDPRFPNT